ncbi:MAG: aminotransferase class IV [Actinomycetota bacterium]|nr:aminotransferase class IV [Actinomycetota bacterium]
MKLSPILINGVVSDGMIPVTDSSVLRGDGCFEVLKAYDGKPFALDGHLDRLAKSAARLDIELPDKDDIGRWISDTARGLGDCALRVVVTRGSSVAGVEGESLVIVFGHDWPADASAARLFPVEVPWHAAGIEWDLAGAKILSYAPNLAATRRATKEGFDDALMMTVDGLVLEGPTFSVGWVIDDVLETPTLELGILDSITRSTVLELASDLGIEVVQGRWGLDRVSSASEVMALSTIREVQVVSDIGDLTFDPGPVTERLRKAFFDLVE